MASKEAELISIRSRIKTTRSGRASVKLAASRFLQAAERSARADNRASQPVTAAQRSAPVSSLLSKWNSGIETEVAKTRVDLNGGRADVRGAKQRFSNVDASLPSPGAAAVAKQQHRRPHTVGPAQFVVEDDDSVPSWAVNQRKTVIKKENARSSIRDVDLGELKGGLLREKVVDTSNVKEVAAGGGGVAAALAKWGKLAEEEAKVMTQRNLVEEAKKKEMQLMEEREAEVRRQREEMERREREEREKREAEERARRLELEKKRLEEEKKRAEEEKRRARDEEVRMLKALPETEPAGAPNAELIDWLEKRIKLLDMLIAEAEAELVDLEKKI